MLIKLMISESRCPGLAHDLEESSASEKQRRRRDRRKSRICPFQIDLFCLPGDRMSACEEEKGGFVGSVKCQVSSVPCVADA